MALTYLDEMRLNRAFLEQLRLRLTGKTKDILPEEGQLYERSEPVSQSLIGSIAVMPDPTYDGPQLPNAIGAVLLVKPEASGRVEVSVSGQFDVVHRYIPSLERMREELIVDGEHLRADQQIPLCHKRFTITFEGIPLVFNRAAPGWVSDEGQLRGLVQRHAAGLKSDPRIYRLCEVNERGNAKYWLPWNDDAIREQADLERVICSEIFEDESRVLEYHVNVKGRLRRVPAGLMSDTDSFFLEVYLVNETTLAEGKAYGVEHPYLLDTRLVVDITVGQTQHVPYRLAPEDYRYQDDDGVPGYGVTCIVEQTGPRRFETRSFPIVGQPRVDAPTAGEVGMRAGPNYDALATDPLPILEDFLAALESYREDWDEQIAGLTASGKADEVVVAKCDKANFEAEIESVRDGVELLRNHDDLQQCFRWMNEAMGRAIRHQGKSFTGWHLFQIAFILTQVRAIYERHAPEAERWGVAELADVLWASTGAGKTEGYLAVLAMAMFYQRLKGRDYGVTAWLRFPLRMLSVQQFQRLSYVVAQANIIKAREALSGHPFTIGYFTGGGTPSRISDASEFSKATFLPLLSEAQMAQYLFVAQCPYCNARDSIRMAKDLSRSRLMHVCTNPTCWSNNEAEGGAYGEGIRGEIGIYVSDEECYRYLPSVLVGTVDKLAVLGHNRRFSAFFGNAKFFCPDHGFTPSGRCEHRLCRPKLGGGFEAVQCDNNSRTSVVKTRPAMPLPDPGFPFLIQDELHLLRESVGNFDAHYESVLAALQIAAGGQTPKVLAATATIREFEHHVAHLYQKPARRFPVPGATQGESFYARRVVDPATGELLIRRWYASLLPMGRGSAALRAVAEISTRSLDQIDEWRQRLEEGDTALMEALGIGPEQACDVQTFLGKFQSSHLLYANKKRDINDALRFLEEANSQRGVVRGHFRLDGESTLEEVFEAIQHIETKDADDQRRQLLATSLVSHGVDIAELNFMVMAGWPKSIAEYIQSTARSGRVHPGLVFIVLSPFKLYENHVFLNFVDYHAFLDRLVESVPINRFAPNVLGRTLPGLIAAVILNWARSQSWGTQITLAVSSLHKVLNDNAGAGAEIGAMVKTALVVPPGIADAFDHRSVAEFQSELDSRVDRTLNRLKGWGKLEQSLGEALGDIMGHGPLRSFRDIENQISIKPVDPSADQLIDALKP